MRRIAFLTVLALAIFMAVVAQAATIQLAWDYDDDEAEKIIGFKMYFQQIDPATNKPVGTVFTKKAVDNTAREMEITDLPGGTTWQFYITAYDKDGESDKSNIVSGTMPMFDPGPDNLPQPIIIQIPGPTTLTIQQSAAGGN